MATRKLLLWFEKRRKSKTLNLAQQQLTRAISTVNELEKTVIAFSNGDSAEVDSSLQRLFFQEVEIDELRRAVFEELTKGELPPKYREDLKGLVEHLDIMADHVKDSARSIKVLMDTKVPNEILNEFVNMAKDLTECANALGDCIEMLGIDPFKATEFAQKVDTIEERVDEGYLRIKSLFIRYSTDIDVATLMEVRDLLNNMENSADICADTADHIRVLASAETTSL